jgi:hypothetical protein
VVTVLDGPGSDSDGGTGTARATVSFKLARLRVRPGPAGSRRPARVAADRDLSRGRPAEARPAPGQVTGTAARVRIARLVTAGGPASHGGRQRARAGGHGSLASSLLMTEDGGPPNGGPTSGAARPLAARSAAAPPPGPAGSGPGADGQVSLDRRWTAAAAAACAGHGSTPVPTQRFARAVHYL